MGFDFDKLSVLVVEDTAPMLKLVVSVLDALGIRQVYTAVSAEEGFQTFCTKQPDIVISDWHMMPTDGLEFVGMIRRHPQSPNRTVPIVLMTGYSALPRVAQARDAGVTEFLVKPFSATDISRRIAYVINKPRDFIISGDFFGPDRRRVEKEDFKGPYRREEDNDSLNKTRIEIG